MASDEPARGPAPPPRLAAALRASISGTIEWLGVLLPVNAAWLVVVVGMALLVSQVPLLVVALPLLALPTTAMTRLAVAAVGSGVPTFRMALEEAGRRVGAKLVIATVQLLVVGMGLTSLSLAPRIGGLIGIVSAIAAGYVVIATWVIATALWPIVCDPSRDAPLGRQARIALAVVVRRPLQVGLLALIAFLAVVVSVRLLLPALLLPTMVLLAVAAYVLPAADELHER